MTSLNPVYTVGWQIAEPLRLHQGKSRREARARAVELLRLVGIPEPETQRRRLPAPALGRAAAARDDRHGPGVRAEAPARRRADHRARRDHPGADPRALARAAAAAVDEHPAHHARSGRGGRERCSTSSSCTPGGWSRAARCARSSPGRCTPTRAACSRASRARVATTATGACGPSRGMVPDLRKLPPVAASPTGARCASRSARSEEPPLAEVAPGRLSACWRASEVVARERAQGAVPACAAAPARGASALLPGGGAQAPARARSRRPSGWRSTSPSTRGGSGAGGASFAPSTACRSACAAARRWGSSARAAAARARSAG